MTGLIPASSFTSGWGACFKAPGTNDLFSVKAAAGGTQCTSVVVAWHCIHVENFFARWQCGCMSSRCPGSGNARSTLAICLTAFCPDGARPDPTQRGEPDHAGPRRSASMFCWSYSHLCSRAHNTSALQTRKHPHSVENSSTCALSACVLQKSTRHDQTRRTLLFAHAWWNLLEPGATTAPLATAACGGAAQQRRVWKLKEVL